MLRIKGTAIQEKNSAEAMANIFLSIDWIEIIIAYVMLSMTSAL